MPFINLKTTKTLSSQDKLNLKSEFGKAISIIPGKSEHWLMVSLQDDATMYFQGSNEQDIAFIEVKIYGKSSSDIYNKLTAKLSEIVSSTLNIREDHIYVSYFETNYWGYNGNNF